MKTIDFTRKLSDESILIEAERVYLRHYFPWLGKYVNLDEYDESILEEFKFRNNMDYSDTVYASQEPRDKYRDCTRFITLERLAKTLLDQLYPISKDTAWFPRLQDSVKELISHLESWTAKTGELTLDCQSTAKEFRVKL